MQQALTAPVTAAFPHHPGDVVSLDCQWNAETAAAGLSCPAVLAEAQLPR